MTDTSSSPLYPAWMARFVQGQPWQSWMPPAQPSADALTAKINELGATIDSVQMTKLQNDYVEQVSQLGKEFLEGKAPEIHDRRFLSPVWNTNPLHAFNAALYLLNARFLTAMADAVQASPKIQQKIRFAVQQTIDAMSPANFLASNPEAQQKLIDTKGESLTKGIAHMLEDMRKGRISQTDETAFEVGTNVATSEGVVIFENALFQLIQYQPLTAKVHELPLLIVPPCINKYYILDLQPDNSLVRYAVESGHTVFLISWRNADESLAQIRWDDYVDDAVMVAIQVVQKISKQTQINALGFCIGGTLLSTALAALAARGEHPVASLTLLTTMLDYSEPGAIEVYIDEMQIALREQAIGNGGLMPGRDFTSAFSSLRPNDLIWNYVGANYLKGEDPRAFDMLFWNADSTNVPGPMFCWYLRNLYLDDALKTPGKLTVAGEKIDLGKIDAPIFIFGSRDDHIVPWVSAYASAALLNPKKPSQNRFVLGASGHIAGVVNPPAKKKRSYWTNAKIPATPEKWLEGAIEHPGSWWTEWMLFLDKHAGKKIPAPKKLGNTKFKAIEPAPGRYVKQKAI